MSKMYKIDFWIKNPYIFECLVIVQIFLVPDKWKLHVEHPNANIFEDIAKMDLISQETKKALRNSFHVWNASVDARVHGNNKEIV